MTDDVRRLLTAIENGRRDDIREAAKELESLATETALLLISLLNSGERADTRAAVAYVLGHSRCACASECPQGAHRIRKSSSASPKRADFSFLCRSRPSRSCPFLRVYGGDRG